jgi:hypothetical protein
MAAAPQRINLRGTLDLDIALNLVDFRSDLRIPPYRITVDGNVPRNSLSLEAREDNHVISSQVMSMDATSISRGLMQNFGLSPAALPISPTGMTPPAVIARESRITLHGEQLQVYEVVISEGSSPVAHIYVTQLGQVILAKTNFGYTLSMDDSL